MVSSFVGFLVHHNVHVLYAPPLTLMITTFAPPIGGQRHDADRFFKLSRLRRGTLVFDHDAVSTRRSLSGTLRRPFRLTTTLMYRSSSCRLTRLCPAAKMSRYGKAARIPRVIGQYRGPPKSGLSQIARCVLCRGVSIVWPKRSTSPVSKPSMRMIAMVLLLSND
jgi:hypothetical protein